MGLLLKEDSVTFLEEVPTEEDVRETLEDCFDDILKSLKIRVPAGTEYELLFEGIEIVGMTTVIAGDRYHLLRKEVALEPELGTPVWLVQTTVG
jgi:hypothetical protein